jgi:hypothetical protein
VTMPSQRSFSMYSLYVLIIMLITYLLNQLDRYMLGIVTKPMSQELHYGDVACMQNDSAGAASDKVLCNATSKLECVQLSGATFLFLQLFSTVLFLFYL